MPVSSLTCTEPPPRAATAAMNDSSHATTSASAPSATSSSPGDSAPMTRIGAWIPASRSIVASPAATTASQLAPPASAARAAGTAPWP